MLVSENVIFGEHDERVVAQLDRCTDQEDGSLGVLCADGHFGYSAPIGGVVAYREHVSPAAVGYDIGCGNMAVQTNLLADDLQPDLAGVMDRIFSEVSFGMGRRDGNAADHPVIDKIRQADFAPQRELAADAAKQLGTVGAGNHYVDLFADEHGRVWVGVHFGSRGFGHKTASGFLAMAKGRGFEDRVGDGEMEAPPDVLHIGSEVGQAYLSAMELAGEYAYAGREVVVAQVLAILGAEAGETIHNHHNYAWYERQGGTVCDRCDGSGEVSRFDPDQGDDFNAPCDVCDGSGRAGGEWFYVVRKGATPAFPGQRGFVGATMGEPAVILEGVESDLSKRALYSTVHGAGRAMSRTKAAGKQRKRWSCLNRDCDYVQAPRTPKPDVCPDCGGNVKKVWVKESEGVIDWDAARADLVAKGIELRGAAADEAPGAYKRLDSVLAAHEGTVRILHTLTPMGVAMAGPDTFDAFKD
jgi:tRNA-splicing ligase RtcB